MSELETLRARVRRLDMDLLAYGRHTETCEAQGRQHRERFKGTRLMTTGQCVCGYHEAIRFRTQGRWPDDAGADKPVKGASRP